MQCALLLMGNTADADCGEDGGPDPSEFMAFDQEINEAGVVVANSPSRVPNTESGSANLPANRS